MYALIWRKNMERLDVTDFPSRAEAIILKPRETGRSWFNHDEFFDYKDYLYK